VSHLIIMWSWITAHWVLVSAALSVALSIANMATPHWKGAAGIARMLGFALEVVSWLRSKDAPAGPLGPLKLPLTSVPPGTPSNNGTGQVLRTVLIVGAVFLLSGCLTTQKALDAVSAASAGGRQAAAVVLDAECAAAAKACPGNVPDKCAAWVTCRDRRRAVYALDETIQVTARQGLALLASGTSVGVDVILANGQALLARLVRLISAYGLTAVPAAPGGAL